MKTTPSTSAQGADTRPANCRHRLQDEGKPYPRSSCTACGKGIATGLGRRCTVPAAVAANGDTRPFPNYAVMPDPSPEMLASPQFEAIWQVIKSWDVNVPEAYSGYCGANGSHVAMILRALTTSPSPAASDASPSGVDAVAGIYIASKAKHGPRWRELRDSGVPIISTWIDEAEAGATSNWPDLWHRCVREASQAAATIVYREPGEVLKGAFVEMGAALAAGRIVFAVGCNEFSVQHHMRVVPCSSLEEALELATEHLASLASATPAPTSGGGDGGRTGAEMIARHRFRLDADNNTAEIDSNGLAEEIDAALAKSASEPAGDQTGITQSILEMANSDPASLKLLTREQAVAAITNAKAWLAERGLSASSEPAGVGEAQIAQWKRDSELLSAIQDQCWDVRFTSTPNADAGDYNVNIEIVGHFMADPQERVVGENYNEDLRAALEQAMTADAYPPARPIYDQPDEPRDAALSPATAASDADLAPATEGRKG